MLSNNISSSLLIFIKNPEKGKVKTRLAATVGDDKALAIYKALLLHTRNIALATDATRLLFYNNAIDTNDEWPNSDFEKQLQQGDALGERLAAAFKVACSRFQKVVIIGSDCASLRSDIVVDAFTKLDDHDFVIGPAMDGGYYLLGMRQFQPAIFQNIEWSTDSVYRDTVQIIEGLGGSFALLEELSDIDVEEDWKRWGWALE